MSEYENMIADLVAELAGDRWLGDDQGGIRDLAKRAEKAEATVARLEGRIAEILVAVEKLLSITRSLQAGYISPAALEEAEALGDAVLAGDGSAPIPMILYCPECDTQHIDAPSEGWDNPPHRSHRCVVCACIWRPADVATTGVTSINTRGKADNWKDDRDAE